MTTPTPPAPGWYPDPAGEPLLRFWDGSRWTPSTQPLAAPRTGSGAGVKAAVVAGVLVVLLALVAGSLLLAPGDGDGEQVGTDGAALSLPPADLAEPSPPAAPAPAGPCAYVPEAQAPARPVTPPTAADVVTTGTYEVVLDSSAGQVVFEVDAARVPCALGSLRSLARQGWFDGTPCHRLTTGGILVLQCGDPTGSGSGGPGYTFADEALEGATYVRGTVAMANRGPDTNGSQLFLVYGESPLPPAYTPVGRITRGLEVLDRVAAAGSDDSNGPGDGRPTTPVLLETVTVSAR